MKSSNHPRKSRKDRGFALVAVLTMMVMLVVVCTATLTLSSVSLRKAGVDINAQRARANARLALVMAIGQLQEAAGPDQRITAPANLVDEKAHPGRTGVWKSQKVDPSSGMAVASKDISSSSPYAEGEFITWLGSGAKAGNTSGEKPPEAGIDAITLLNTGNLPLKENPVSLNSGKLAWATIDESVKARFNLPQIESGETEKTALRAPMRVAADVLDDLEALKLDEKQAAGMVSFRQGELAIKSRKKFANYFNDLTSWSSSLPVNTVDGGFKADLTRLFEADRLPSRFADYRLYSGESTPLVPADPYLSELASWYRLNEKNPNGATPLQTTIPVGYVPSEKKRDASGTRTVPRLAALSEEVLAPVVTKVQVVFSLVAREAHGEWAAKIAASDPELKYMLYLIYSPAVTLHNPYNVPLNVNGLQVSFSNMPLAFQIFRNGSPQTARPALLSQLHGYYENTDTFDDKFVVRLANKPVTPVPGSTGAGGDTNLKLMPGEAKVFGLSHPAGTTFMRMSNFMYDATKSLTESLTPGPGWDYRCGFVVDVLRPNIAGRQNNPFTGYIMPVRGRDTIDVASTFMPLSGGKVKDFSVTVSANVNTKQTDLGMYNYHYESVDKLKQALQGEHPELGTISYPFRREKAWKVPEIYQQKDDTVPFEKWTGPQPFAIFSLGAKTACGSLHPSKPGRDSSFVHQVVDIDITKAHPAQYPLEASFLPIRQGGAGTVGSIEIANDGTDRVYHFSGSTRENGILNMPSYEVPAAPMVNIAELRHANLASSGHFPFSTYTVGESRAHPMLPKDRPILRNSRFGYDIADHSWLANNALWDKFYFSGIRTQGDVTSMMEGRPLEISPRNKGCITQGMKRGDAEKVLLGDDSWSTTARFQRIDGAFNVNSTSINAWKAVLSSLKDQEIPIIDPVSLATSNSSTSKVPFPRLVRSSGSSIDSGSASDNQLRWNGYRDLDEKEIDALAKAIVDQVKERGPFKSMSDFVNRRLTGNADESSAGALEAAIRIAGLNKAAMESETRNISTAEAAVFGYENPDAAAGGTEEASRAYLSQGDILSGLGAYMTVRSDTFVIRAYGDVRSKDGKVLAKATIEAVVQRQVKFVDPADDADKVQPILGDQSRTISSLTSVNQKFGRRFEVVNFRWLQPSEI